MIKNKCIVLLFVIANMFVYPQLPASEIEILGIGAPCMDLLVHVDDHFLDSIKAEKAESKLVDWNEFCQLLNHLNSPVQYATGGSCSNTIKGLSHLNWHCAIAGKIGNDEMSCKYLNTIQALDIRSFFIHSEIPTSQILAMITPDSQRTFRVFPGSGTEFKGNELDPKIFEKVRLVHIEGYSLYNDGLTETAMKYAKQSHALISIDLASFKVVERYKSEILTLLPKYVDIVFANESEVQALTGLDPISGGRKLKELCPTVVVLLGAKGVYVVNNEKECFVPAEVATAVDTTGAGDLFASGFLHGYLKGCTIEQCAKFGCLLGGTVVEVIGGEIPKERWLVINRKLQHYFTSNITCSQP